MSNKLKIIKSGRITRQTEGSACGSCTFPGICLLPGNRMIASFKGSPKKTPLAGENGYLCYSEDAGETWTEPAAPFPDGVNHEGRTASFRGIYATHLTGPRVLAVMPAVYEGVDGAPYYNEETEGILDTDIFYSHSEDYGRTFAPPKRMDTGFNQPVPLTGPVVRLADGKLICQFELNKTYSDTDPWVHSSVIILSKDGGVTWADPKIITRHPSVYYWDQRIGLMENGGLLDLFWTFDREKARYLSIHACESPDGGANWSPLWDAGLPGQPGAPADAGGGHTAAIFIDRSGPPKIAVRLSCDGGRTFAAEELIVYDSSLTKQEKGKSSMNDAWAEMSAFSVGHPNLARLPSGELYAYYYAGPHTDRTDICFAKITVSR